MKCVEMLPSLETTTVNEFTIEVFTVNRREASRICPCPNLCDCTFMVRMSGPCGVTRQGCGSLEEAATTAKEWTCLTKSALESSL